MAMARAHWGSKLGFVMAAAGSAVGLGNLWKFPYVTWENNGGAFVLVYLVAGARPGAAHHDGGDPGGSARPAQRGAGVREARQQGLVDRRVDRGDRRSGDPLVLHGDRRLVVELVRRVPGVVHQRLRPARGGRVLRVHGKRPATDRPHRHLLGGHRRDRLSRHRRRHREGHAYNDARAGGHHALPGDHRPHHGRPLPGPLHDLHP